MDKTGIKNRRAYMLKMATDGQVIHLDISGVREMVRLLSNATNSINQIAKKTNETGNIHAGDIAILQGHIDDIWGQAKEILRKLAAL
jgi:hypothetical protein